MLHVKVFEKNSREAIMEAKGSDPTDLATKIAAFRHIAKGERTHIRNSLENALKVLQGRSVANLTNMQLDVGGRRIRVSVS